MNKNKKDLLGILHFFLTVVLLIILIVVLYKRMEDKDTIASLNKQIDEYSETIEKVEEEVGIIEDLKYQIEGYDITLVRKMHELEELESQIADKQADLDALNNQ